MKIKDLRELKEKQLIKRLAKTLEEYSEVAFDISSGTEKDFSEKRKKRVEIARIRTLLREIQILNVKKRGSVPNKEVDTPKKEKIKKDEKEVKQKIKKKNDEKKEVKKSKQVNNKKIK